VCLLLVWKLKVEVHFAWQMILANCVMILLLLGLVFAEQIIRFFKGGSAPTDPPEEEENKLD
jgi:hypothetical protein